MATSASNVIPPLKNGITALTNKKASVPAMTVELYANPTVLPSKWPEPLGSPAIPEAIKNKIIRGIVKEII